MADDVTVTLPRSDYDRVLTVLWDYAESLDDQVIERGSLLSIDAVRRLRTEASELRDLRTRLVRSTGLRPGTWCRAHGTLDDCPEHCPRGGGYFHGDSPCSHHPNYGCIQADGTRHGGS